jgi:adenylate cyclase class IV
MALREIMIPNAPFEVEIRFHLDDRHEAFKSLPFLSSCLTQERKWRDTFYGQAFFESGSLLRISKVVLSGKERRFLGWKGPDIGQFANIRQEVNEEITNGVASSAIIRSLGGKEGHLRPHEVAAELQRLGHSRYMSFRGHNLVGYYEPLGIDIKLMVCSDLKWALLLEIEKIAQTAEEARKCEADLREFCGEFQLQKNMVREEPPTLLYSGIFGRQDGGV